MLSKQKYRIYDKTFNILQFFNCLYNITRRHPCMVPFQKPISACVLTQPQRDYLSSRIYFTGNGSTLMFRK